MVFFAQVAVMLLGGAALIGPGGARYLFAALLTGYELLFVSRLGQTPAKDRLDVKVAVRPTDHTPGLARAMRRWAPVLVILLVPDLRIALAVAVVTVAPMLVDGRGLHDHLAGTWVVAYDADEHEEEGVDVDFGPLDRLRRHRRVFGWTEHDDDA